MDSLGKVVQPMGSIDISIKIHEFSHGHHQQILHEPDRLHRTLPRSLVLEEQSHRIDESPRIKEVLVDAQIGQEQGQQVI